MRVGITSPVVTALLLWLTALVVLEAGLGLVAGRDGIRLVPLALATVLTIRMAAGRNWARHTLAVVFGLGATPWLAVGAWVLVSVLVVSRGKMRSQVHAWPGRRSSPSSTGG